MIGCCGFLDDRRLVDVLCEDSTVYDYPVYSLRYLSVSFTLVVNLGHYIIEDDEPFNP